jgi:hypothetical protein
MRRGRIVLALVAALAVVPSASAHAADKAAVCKNGGWQTVVRSEDQSPFKNQGECVSYVAHGGTPVMPDGGGGGNT